MLQHMNELRLPSHSRLETVGMFGAAGALILVVLPVLLLPQVAYFHISALTHIWILLCTAATGPTQEAISTLHLCMLVLVCIRAFRMCFCLCTFCPCIQEECA